MWSAADLSGSNESKVSLNRGLVGDLSIYNSALNRMIHRIFEEESALM